MHLNIVLHGAPGVGKSSSKRVILGEDPLPEQEQNSTDIMENAVRAVSIDRIKQFAVITNEELIELLAEMILNNIEKSKQQLLGTEDDELPTANQSSASDDSPGVKVDAPADESNSVVPRPESKEDMLTKASTKSSTVDQKSPLDPDSKPTSVPLSTTLLTIIEKLNNAKPSSAIFDSKWHHLIDSGGQPQFQDILPLLYRSPSFKIVLMRLTEGLDEKPKMCYTEKGKNALKLQHCLQLTNRQYIEKMCQIAASSDPKSHVMVVGTHKDKLGNDRKANAKIEELNKGLQGIREKYKEVLVCKSDDEVVFNINTMATGREREEYTKELQGAIEEVSEELAQSTPVPLKWLAFQLDINNDSGIVRIEDCYKSGKALGMEEHVVRSALVYFNRAALLLYYPDDVPDLVLTKVDPLVTKLSQLVKASFITPKRLLQSKCEELRNTGVFNRDFLDKIVDESPSTGLSNDELLKLLVCLKITVPVRENEYFLPSALSFDPPSEDVLFSNSCLPVGFSWSDCLLPHGFFFTVIIELLHLSDDNGSIFELCTKLNQCRDEISFCEKNSKIPGVFKLTNMTRWIQVSTSSPKEYCPAIYKAVNFAIQKALERFQHTAGLKLPTVVSLCPLCPTRDHYCTLTPDKAVFTCSERVSAVGSVTPEMSCWREGQSVKNRQFARVSTTCTQ